jgi:hypothetical protein
MWFLWFLIALPLATVAFVWFFVTRRKPVEVARVYPFPVRRDPLKELYEKIEQWELWECEECGTTHVGIKGDCLHGRGKDVR